MIRLVQRKLIIPRGDTGSFSIPAIAAASISDVAVFTIFDCLTHSKVYEKSIAATNEVLTFEFTHNDTVNLPCGQYVWDIKFYKNPVYADNELINGDEIDSYYAGYTLPTCEIRETGDSLLVSSDAPSGVLAPEQLNILNATLSELNNAIEQTESNVRHYPQIVDGDWYLWDAETSSYVDSGNSSVGPGVSPGGSAGQILKKASAEDFDTEWIDIPVKDVQVENVSVVDNNEVANIPYATPSTPGVIRANPTYGLVNVDNTDVVTGKSTTYTSIMQASAAEIKAGEERCKPITPKRQHTSVFYGLAKAAGDSTQAASDNAVGTYTADAKAAIQTMLDVPSNQDLTNAISAIDTMRIHICTAQEYNSETGVPTIQTPDTQTLYLVPGGASNNLYIEWAYINNTWEKFGQADIDLSVYATKADTVLSTTLSRGRKANTNIGIGSFAFGNQVEASGVCSHAEGSTTIASGNASHAEGLMTTASANYSHAEGYYTTANGAGSHVSGSYTIANGSSSNVYGEYNIPDSYDSWPEWDANNAYNEGDIVKVTTTIENETTVTGYIALTENQDEEFTPSHWKKDNRMNYIEIVGNGTANNARSNARILDWYGNETLAGDLTLGGNLNRGRKANTLRGYGSITFGDRVEASGSYSQAFGTETVASGIYSHAEGDRSVAAGNSAHAEGGVTHANGQSSHAEGVNTVAAGYSSHAEGNSTIANGSYSHTAGKYNVEDSYTSWPTWTSGTEYAVGDKIKLPTYDINNNFSFKGYICKVANNDTEFTLSNWRGDLLMNYADIVGNGTANNARSNAYALDWEGNGYYAGDVYVGANADSTGGTKLAKVTDLPNVPVQDVQVNGASILSNGIANVPIATSNALGVVIPNSTYGLAIDQLGNIGIARASSSYVKSGSDKYKPIVPYNQHESVYYGLSKVAGADLANETVTLGIYPDTSKAAIQHMLGTDTIIAPNETDPFTSAHVIGELFTMNGKLYRAKTAIAVADAVNVGTNCEEVSVSGAMPHDVQVNGVSVVSDGVADIPLIDNQGTVGVVKNANGTYGLMVASNGYLAVASASDTQIKSSSTTGSAPYRAITPSIQHAATFYGLAKAAGDTTQSSSSNAVGTYTSSAKNAIHTMLGTADLIEVGFVETVTGTTPSITGKANYRYNCGELATLSITPPSAGSIDVYFTSGSTATVLTVPNTVKWPVWFDATSLDSNTIYELLITDATYGSVMTWATT